MKRFLAVVCTVVLLGDAVAGIITTFAGGGNGVDPSPPPVEATQVILFSPRAVVVDAAGDFHFAHVTDGGTGAASAKSIHKVSGGIMSTRIGAAGGVSAMAIDAAGNIYYADAASHQVKKLDLANAVTVIAGTGTAGYGGDNGPATSAQLNTPMGITVVGADILVSDASNHRIRRISGGNIATVAGTGVSGYDGDLGQATAARINAPAGVVGDGAGGFYFIHTVSGLTTNMARVRHVDGAGIIRPVASLSLPAPGALARDSAGSLYIAGGIFGSGIHRVDSAGNVTVAAGTVPGPGPLNDGGPATQANVFQPFGVAFAPSGEMYIADTSNHRIRKVNTAGIITTVAGGGSPPPPYIGDGGPATNAVLMGPLGVSVDPAGNVLIADNPAHRVRRVDAAGTITTFAGVGIGSFSGDGGPATAAGLFLPSSTVSAGGVTYIADFYNRRIRRVDATGTIATVAGIGPSGPGVTPFGGDGGPASAAMLGGPGSLALDASGNLYLADAPHGRVRRITPAGQIDTVAGDGTFSYRGEGVLATRVGIYPSGIALDAAGNLFIADQNAKRVYKVDASGLLTTVAGNGSGGFSGDGGPAVSASFSAPWGLAFDPSGNLYVSDLMDNRVRRVGPDGVVVTVAGNGSFGLSGDGGDALAAKLAAPTGLAWHGPASALLVVDSENDRVRKIAVADETPAAFQFAPRTGVAPSSVVQSASITPAAFDVAAPISVAGGEYSIGCTGAFTAAAGTFSPGQSVCVRHTAAALDNATTTTALTIGGVKGLFASTTLPGAGSFSASPAPVDFGTRWIYYTLPVRPITITNTGGVTLTVHSITTGVPFSLTHDCTTPLAPGATCTAQVTFKPFAEGPATGAATIQTSAGTQAVALSGAGSLSLTSHYYQSILGRAPDSGGLAFWDGEAARIIAAGANVVEAWYALAMQFYFSAEYVARARDNAGFATDLYLTFFNRVPDSGGLAYWKGQLDQGMPREVLLAQFMFSPEFLAFTNDIFGIRQVRPEVDLAMDFYRGLLARLPDNTGLEFWVRRFRASQCAGPSSVRAEAASISGDFVGSPEYAARNRTDAQYVGDLYNAFFRRGGDLPGVQYWIGQLSSGARTRASLLNAFVSSPEFSSRVNNVLSAGCITPDAPVTARYATLTRPAGLAVDGQGNAYFVENDTRVRRISASGVLTTHAELPSAKGIAVDAAGNVYVATTTARVHRIDLSKVVTVVAGDGTAGFSGDGGPATAARLGGEVGVAIDSAGDLLIADNFNRRVRKVSGGVIRTVAGNGNAGLPGGQGDGGPALQAPLTSPSLVASDGSGGFYVVDTVPVASIRHVNAAGTISTFATLPISFAAGLSRDPAGNLFVSGGLSPALVYKISPAGAATIFAGGGTGGDGVPATSAGLNWPHGLAASASGEVYFAEYGGNRIRKVRVDGIIETIAGATYP